MFDLLAHEPNVALRGAYELNRITGVDTIVFSSQRGKPLDEVEIHFEGK